MSSAIDTLSTASHPSTSAIPTEIAELAACLKAENTILREALSASQVTVDALKARIAELGRQLGLNSSNSGKPPSTDGLKKPPKTSSLRTAADKRTGGQPGHKGGTLCQVAEPNSVIDLYPNNCQSCGVPLTSDMATTYSTRQVFDLPKPQPLVVTEHRAPTCQCEQCGKSTRAIFPEQVKAPVQYGWHIVDTLT